MGGSALCFCTCRIRGAGSQMGQAGMIQALVLEHLQASLPPEEILYHPQIAARMGDQDKYMLSYLSSWEVSPGD